MTQIDVNVNQLAYSTIQNVIGACHVRIKDNILTL